MAPNLLGSTNMFLAEATITHEDQKSRKAEEKPAIQSQSPPSPASKEPKYRWSIVWRNVFAFLYLHLGTLYGFYLILFQAKILTVVFAVLFAGLSAMGVTAGAHRLWAHKCYKAKWPLRIFLTVLQTMAFQNHIYEWVRDHRVHHKFSETDADPHNAKRGFFFSHIGWLMLRKHNDVFVKGAAVDMSDLEKDPIVMFQKRTYLLMMPLLCFVIPTWIPCRLWGESPWVSWYVASVWRFTVSLNFTWLVNSAAHIWGNRPYDKSIGATDNVYVALIALGEGWHNYHHVFPWDYKAAELGNYNRNISTGFIDLCARLGLAYDMKTVSVEMIRKRVKRTGDGSHPFSLEEQKTQDLHEHPENPVWGWDDIDMTEEDKKCVEFSHRKTE